MKVSNYNEARWCSIGRHGDYVRVAVGLGTIENDHANVALDGALRLRRALSRAIRELREQQRPEPDGTTAQERRP